MKHSDTYRLYRRLKYIEIEELKRALNAHKGSYTWADENDCPIVTYNPESPFDIRIEKIWTDGCSIYFNGRRADTNEFWKDCKITDVEFGHLDFIISEIPETEEVSDVSSDIEFEITDSIPTTSINEVFLCGRVGSVKIQEVGETKLARFTLCTSRTYKNDADESVIETSWHIIEAYESPDIDLSCIKQNNVLYLKGHLKYDRFTDLNNVETINAKICATSISLVISSKDEYNN